MKTRNVSLVFAAAAFAIAATPYNAWAVNSCTITGNPGPLLIDANNPYYDETACPSDTPCGCTVSGTNCIFKLSTDITTSSSSTCLTLGSGVTFDLDGNTLTCTGSDCGKAVDNTSSSGSSSKVVIKNGKITGCFDAGLYFSGGTDSSVSDMEIDIGSSCSNGISFLGGSKTVGISWPRGLIARARVRHANIAVHLASGQDIEDSVLSDNVHGLIPNGTTQGIDNVLFANNDYHIWEYKGSFNPDIQGSSFIGAAVCNCSETPTGVSTAENCQTSLNDCGTFQSPLSHVCDPSDTGDFCTFE